MSEVVVNLQFIDPYFGVYRETSAEGALEDGEPPPDAKDHAFWVWDAEGEVVTVALPFVDACWIAKALNAAAKQEG